MYRGAVHVGNTRVAAQQMAILHNDAEQLALAADGAARLILWRLTHTPPLPSVIPRWEVMASRLIHLALYGLLFAIPLSGWLMSSVKGVRRCGSAYCP